MEDVAADQAVVLLHLIRAYADRMIELYDEVAPNFKASILHRDVVGPYQMEQDYGLIGGNIFHGELSLEQLFHMRPARWLRRLPHADQRPVLRQFGDPRGRRRLRDPGWQAARAALTDRKLNRAARAPRAAGVGTRPRHGD